MTASYYLYPVFSTANFPDSSQTAHDCPILCIKNGVLANSTGFALANRSLSRQLNTSVRKERGENNGKSN